MLSVTVPPTGRANGVVMPVAEKPPPLTLTWLMVVFVVPLFVRLTMFVLLDPVLTVPKATSGVTRALCASAEFGAVEMDTTMPTRIATTRIRIIRSIHLYLELSA
jgi:hypothetical protein